MAEERDWAGLVEQVVERLAPEERAAFEEWAADAPRSARTPDGALDHIAAARFAAAAAEASVRWIPEARTLDPGEAVVEGRLDGRVVRRAARLAPVPVTRSVWNGVGGAAGL